jgi:hypothetical protein
MASLENIIRKEPLVESDFESLDWDNNPVALGFLLGHANSPVISKDLLLTALHSKSVPPFCRAFLVVSLLTSLNRQAKELYNTQEIGRKNGKKNDPFREITELLEILIGIAFHLQEILNTSGELAETIIQTYSSLLDYALCSFGSNDSIIKLVNALYPFKNILKVEHIIFELTYEEIQKLARWTDETASEITKIVGKGYSIVQRKSAKTGNALSIICFNTFVACLRSGKHFDRLTLVEVDQILIKYISCFSDKQKIRFSETYNILCQKNRLEQNEEVRKGLQVGVHEKNRQNEYRIKRGDRPNTMVSNRNYRRVENNEDRVAANSVKKETTDLITEMRKSIKEKEYVDQEMLVDRLIYLSNRSQSALFEILRNFSYYEKIYSIESISLWTTILEGVANACVLDNEQMAELQYYVRYMEENME